MQGRPERRPGPALVARVVLAAFVLAWIFGPYWLRSTIPIWLAFAVAAGLEVHFAVSAWRAGAPARHARGPQGSDRDRFGYPGEPELLLVREGGEELWISYDGETGEELEALIASARAEEPDAEEEDVGMAGAHGRRPRSGPLSRFAAGAVVIGLLAGLVWIVQGHTGWASLAADTRARAVARFSDEASRIAGKAVSIRCDESGSHVGVVQDADGVAVVGGALAYLTPDRCYDLYRLAFEGEVRSSETGRALAVLAHESWHLRGVADEGTTECYALQTGVELGRRLGLSQGTAEQMMRQQLVENVDRGAANLEYLVPPGCRNGGELDLSPGVDRFP